MYRDSLGRLFCQHCTLSLKLWLQPQAVYAVSPVPSELL